MTSFLLRVFAFAVVNLLLIPLHTNAFQSPIPFTAWVTITLHLIGLIIFPYSRFFKISQ